ncbi:MAG: HAD hydrolase-like protein [Candidatus Pacebacteria bacterium]|nr:HAD hydrolase-like protein [Candidatus Paceibacterota bacterium]
MSSISVLWDWDGTAVNTMPRHADLAAKCIVEVFGIDYQVARRRYLETTGIPFDKQLEVIFPTADMYISRMCAKMYHQRKIEEVYSNPEDFPELLSVLYAIRDLKIHQFISSSTEEKLIKDWAKDRGIEEVFYQILGRESGTKQDHIAYVKTFFDGDIVFISDSVGDMSLPAICLGVDVPSDKEDLFMKSNCFEFTNDPINLEWVMKIIKMLT